MTIEEIRKNAPDGATHYRILQDSRIVYYKIIEGWSYFYHYIDIDWVCSTIHSSLLKPLH